MFIILINSYKAVSLGGTKPFQLAAAAALRPEGDAHLGSGSHVRLLRAGGRQWPLSLAIERGTPYSSDGGSNTASITCTTPLEASTSVAVTWASLTNTAPFSVLMSSDEP